MAATKSDISRWFDEGVERDATHMIVVCDTFDHDDYPSYVSADQDAREFATEKYGYPETKNMQRVMEVYDLRKDKAAQVNEHRAFNW